MEISGQNALNQHGEITDLSSEQKNNLKRVSDIQQGNIFKGSAIIILILFLVLAFYNYDTGPGIGTVAIESIVFGLAGCAPSIMQSKNRNVPINANNTLVNHFLLFAGGHFVLQLGGMYTFNKR